MAQLVGVTGTNGKTSTARWAAAALGALSARPVLCLDSVAWRIGDRDLGRGRTEAALDAALADFTSQGGDVGVIELMSHALGTGFGRALAFEVGVFTNLTPEHLDVHGTLERYLACKAQLFIGLRPGSTAVLNANDDACRVLARLLQPGVECLTYGLGARGPSWCEADVTITDIVVGAEGTRARLAWRVPSADAPGSLFVPAIGAVFIENAVAAMLAASACGVPLAVAASTIASCPPPPGRFVRLAHAPDVYLDLAHTPDALARTLVTGRALAERSGGRLLLVFGSGGQRDVGKRAQMGRAARDADWAIVTTDEGRGSPPMVVARAIAVGMGRDAHVHIELNRLRAIEKALEEASPDDGIRSTNRVAAPAPAGVYERARRYFEWPVDRVGLGQHL